MLGCNKNDATLALNYILKNSEGTISVLGMYKRDRNKNIIVEKTYKNPIRVLMNAKRYC